MAPYIYIYKDRFGKGGHPPQVLMRSSVCLVGASLWKSWFFRLAGGGQVLYAPTMPCVLPATHCGFSTRDNKKEMPFGIWLAAFQLLDGPSGPALSTHTAFKSG